MTVPSPARTRALVFTAAAALGLSCSSVTGGTEDPVATSIALDATSVTLDAVGASQAVAATVQDQDGNSMAGQTIAWTSDDATVATVSSSGTITAVRNGSTTARVTSGSLENTVSVTVAQAPTQLNTVAGDGTSAAVGSDVTITVEVLDRLDVPVPDVAIGIAITEGDGTLDASSLTSDAAGQASAVWTLGNTSGAQEVTATLSATTGVSVAFGATATAGAASAISRDSGNDQTGIVNAPLANPIAVKVADGFGNGVEGHDVVFGVTEGSIAPVNATTDAEGVATATWTLGATVGSQTATVTAPGLTGSPVTFDATGSTLSVSTVTPDPLVEGQSATITGTGFDATAANNTVTVGGAAAIVTTASNTSLTITVPTFDCRPARDVSVVVSHSGQSSNTVTERVHPAAVLNMAVGDFEVLDDPSDFCLQFLPDATGGDEYLIGTSATSEVNSVMAFQITSEAGAATAPPLTTAWPAPPTRRSLPPVALTPLAREIARTMASQDDAERRIRAWDRANFGRNTHPRLLAPRRAPSDVAVTPNEGDMLTIHVPNLESSTFDFCGDFNDITVTVRKVGTRGVFATDNANPTDDPLTDQDIEAFSDTFDDDIYDVLVANFGNFTDIDDNGQRVMIVLTREVNALSIGAAGFVISTDLRDPTSCASSNQGEIFYGYVPDPNNTAGGPFAHTRAGVIGNMPALIAHEVTHNIQTTRREAASGSPLATWESEGQADLAKELLGFSQRPDTPGQDLDFADATSFGTSDPLYAQRFARLGRYFGWDNSNGRVNDAPHQCSLFGYTDDDNQIKCKSAYFYGASWSLHRFVLDRFGATYPGGVAQLEQDWIGANPNLTGSANVAALLGVDFNELFVEWAAMLYVDGRVNGLPSSLEMASWDLFDIYNGFDPSLSLTPDPQTFGAFTASGGVRGGSTFYTLVTAPAGQRGAAAIRLRDGSDDALAPTLAPRFWVVRTR